MHFACFLLSASFLSQGGTFFFFFNSIFVFLVFFGFFSLSFVDCLCRAGRIQYDDMTLHVYSAHLLHSSIAEALSDRRIGKHTGCAGCRRVVDKMD